MTLLLDSHVLLWALLDPGRIRATARAEIENPENEVYVSAASAWELSIKQGLGKLELPGPAESWLLAACEATRFTWIDITPQDAVRVRALPPHHQDPFDRLLIATAQRGYTLVTADHVLAAYGVPILRA